MDFVPLNSKSKVTVVAAAAGGVLLSGVLLTSALRAPDGEVVDAPGPGETASAAQPQMRVGPQIVRESETEGKVVNLTLDDGPDPTWTPKVLALLKQYDVNATFCMIGPNARKYPELVMEVVAEGHRLCDHSVSHDTAMDSSDLASQTKEILGAKEMIDEASGGARVWYYRAPGGAFTPESREVAASHGMANLGWNVDPLDWKRPGSDRIVQAVQKQLQTKGSTILMHDGGGERSQSVEALARLLPWLKDQGYGFGFPEIPEAG